MICLTGLGEEFQKHFGAYFLLFCVLDHICCVLLPPEAHRSSGFEGWLFCIILLVNIF